MNLHFGKKKNKYNFGINNRINAEPLKLNSISNTTNSVNEINIHNMEYNMKTMKNGIHTAPVKLISISDTNIDNMEHNMNTIKLRVPSLFVDNKDNKEDNYYFASTGVTNLRLTTYNEFIHDQAILFFNILSRHQRESNANNANTIEYAVFAGNSVGLLRGGNNLPWGDDYDIIIFEKHATIFLQIIAPELENFGFKTETIISNDANSVVCGMKIFGPSIQFNKSSSSFGTSVFQCDVFFSYFDNNKFLKNLGRWGLYHQKNIPYDVVVPFKRRMFHGMFLPFFNNPKKEVEICYTNIDKCSIFSHHLIKSETIFYKKWENAYLDFEYIIKNSIENTKKAINANFNHNPNTLFHKIELVLNAGNKNIFLGENSCILSKLNFFSYLSQYNVGSIVAHTDASEFICQHAADVKYYFPEIEIMYIDDGCKPSPISPIFYIYIDVFIIQSEK